MFMEDRSNSRDNWKYTYKAKDLLPKAQAKYKEAFAKEKEARETAAAIMKDMNIQQSDPRIRETKQDIEKFGILREQCSVFCHEFARDPEREYTLAMGDVVFFNLVGSETT